MSIVGSVSTSSNDQLTNDSKQPAVRQIALVDHTKPAGVPVADEASDVEWDPNAPPESSSSASVKRWTSTSLKQQLAQRKYRRYRDQSGPEVSDPGTVDGAAESAPGGRLERGKKIVRGILKKKHTQAAEEEEAVIDISYENQRGSFFFGIPLFSSKSLLNFDPKPWVNAYKKPSPVNITNAQVPDPSWEWAWKSWYVDMSHDVDEEGWEYSFSFQQGFAWHGTHPWFHSFVRRRRWSRKRVRKHAHHGAGKAAGQRHMSEAHMLTPEYFTIHPSRPRSIESGTATMSTAGRLDKFTKKDEEEEKDDIRDIGSLMRLSKKASVDREKLVLVRNFIDHASDDSYYLSERMSTIMALLIFQNSRRQLLGMSAEKFDTVQAHRDEHIANQEDEGVIEKRKIDYLSRAVSAADAQVKKSEYWSDIRNMAHSGQTSGATDEENGWTSEEWQGLDPSGPGNNEVSKAKEPGKSVGQVERESRVDTEPEEAPVPELSSGEVTPRPGISPERAGVDVNVGAGGQGVAKETDDNEEGETGIKQIRDPEILVSGEDEAPTSSDDPFETATEESFDSRDEEEELPKVNKGKGRADQEEEEISSSLDS